MESVIEKSSVAILANERGTANGKARSKKCYSLVHAVLGSQAKEAEAPPVREEEAKVLAQHGFAEEAALKKQEDQRECATRERANRQLSLRERGGSRRHSHQIDRHECLGEAGDAHEAEDRGSARK